MSLTELERCGREVIPLRPVPALQDEAIDPGRPYRVLRDFGGDYQIIHEDPADEVFVPLMVTRNHSLAHKVARLLNEDLNRT